MSTPAPTRRRRAPIVLGAVLGAIVVFLAGVLVGGHPRSTGINDLPQPIRGVLQGSTGDPVAAEVLQLLEDGYYKRIDPDRLERASVDGLLKGLDDRYSYYLDPEQYAELQRQTEGIFFGVGMQVSTRGRNTVVNGVYDDSPAKRAGVRAGDIIVAVNGEPVIGEALDAVVAKVRGPEGTKVTVRFRRGTTERDVELTRARIKIPLVAQRVETVGGKKIGYVRLAEFDRGAAGELRSAVEDLRKRDVDALVFDLRGDPGGLVDEAVGVVGVFTKSGSPVVTTQGLHRDRETLRTRRGPATTTVPLIVLVDQNSASASEIVAGALRDNDRARIVGTRTFGKALVQTTRELRNGGALRYTTARYLTPDGVDVSRNGLKPDVQAKDNPDTRPDEALQRALALAAQDR